ncbi:MAG: heme-hemopexin-binding/utilization protein, partial [Alphaproteobacteria bacterium]|nr:heme-hemopexin-binding/utilization protein [Alphaproteobacteria bacterium]
MNTAGGFVASTLDMADADFMAGRLNFSGKGASASVSNAGRISAGSGAYVALLGGAVSNSGYISVPLGKVALGSGEQVALDVNGGGFMQVAVPTSLLTGSNALIDNSGSITARGGTVVLQAAVLKDAVRNVINMAGSINADSATGDGGTIHLIGGADTSSMAGTVTVSGSLSAQATGASGNGGFIETSGAHVNLNGLRVNTGAAHGKTGTWLIDPTDFTVAASGGDITGAQLSANLNATGVTIDSNNGASGINGDVNFNDAVTWSTNNGLNVSAFRNININAAITNTNPNSTNINLLADDTGTGTGTVTFGAGGSINTVGAFVNIFYNPTSYATPTDFTVNVP